MKAVRIHAYGGPDVLAYEDAPLPAPGQGEVLIRVHSAGVNPVDWKIREGWLRKMLAHHFPLILGWDVSGVVEAVGPGESRLKPGAAVYSRPDIARDGAYAEYMVARGAEVALKPRAVDHVQAASLPLAGLTAWQSLFDAAALSAGQKVLIHAAAGGVGSLAVQLAKWKGAHVVGTASARNQDFVRSLGADQVIDYQAGDFTKHERDFDVVLDTLGADTQERSWGVLKRGGILVSIFSRPNPEAAAAHGVRQAFVFIQPNADQLAQIALLVDNGTLKPIVSAVLPLAEARRAHDMSQAGHVRGKIVLDVAGRSV